MIGLPGFQTDKEIYISANSRIMRARRIADKTPVILKILNEEYPAPEKIVRFRREYEILQAFQPLTPQPLENRQVLPGVVYAYGWERYLNTYVIIMEDIGGLSLDQWLISLRDSRLQELALPSGHLAVFLSLAIRVTKALEQIHQRKVIHKDINPSNIIFNPQTSQVKIIDFGISTTLSRETTTFRNPGRLEGTLAYISPEQTGRMNRTVDYRTDFYSLGVTFYELLTGQRPFVSSDALELVHSHIARQPVPPHELQPGVPRPLSDLIIKLLTKNAEDRYQSTRGILVDLEECLQQWQAARRIEPFPLGRQDVSEHFQIPQKLYGRDSETKTLLAASERTSQGKSEMLLISGFPGIGKTALVQEIFIPITRQRGYFISGKFDQYERNTPYLALIQAFRSLIRQLLGESEVQIAAWKEMLAEALGPNGQVILDVIPEMELIIGPQPPVPVLGPSEAQNRFRLVFENFIRVYTRPEHPLVIFLDDFQWADGASLKLIELLMSAPESNCLLLTAAYRENEVNATHPAMMTVEAIKKAGAVVNHLQLEPLALMDINHLIADTLHCKPDRARLLAELTLEKTGGNPYFILEFLKSLYGTRLITFNPRRGIWLWDLAKIQAQAISDKVVELVAGKALQLPVETQQVLKLAACIGNTFDLKTLATVYEQSPHSTAFDLWEAVATGLILPLNDAYKLVTVQAEEVANEAAEKIGAVIEYKFAHDRVQQAIYSLIPADQRPGIHLRLGHLLLKHTPQEEGGARIFNIVKQLNLGRGKIDGLSEKKELAQLNLEAGKKAKAAAAYEPALFYLKIGIGLLPEDSWLSMYDLTLSLYVEATEAAFLSGRFEQMEQFTEVVLGRAHTLLDKIKVYEIKIQALTIQDRAKEALQLAFSVLNLFGVDLPEQPTMADISQGLQETQALLGGKTIDDLYELPTMTDPEKLAAMRILSYIMSPAHIAMPEIFPLLVLRQVNLSILHGNSPVSSVGYSLYGWILCGNIGDIETGYRFGQLALKLLDKMNTREIKAMVVQLVAIGARHWKEPFRAILPCLPEAYQIGIETGDLAYAGYSAHQVCLHSYFAGLELTEVEQKSAMYNTALANIKQKTALQWNQANEQVALNLQGQSEHPSQLIGTAYDERVMIPILEQANDGSGLSSLYLHKLILDFIFEDYPSAVEHAALAEKYLGSLTGLLLVPLFHFYDSLARLAAWPNLSPSEQKTSLAKVVANQEKFKLWSQHAPTNYLHKYYLVEAERARLAGHEAEAREFYDQAITLAHENEFLNEEALAYELAARFYIGRDQNWIARHYLYDAHYAYRLWGATAKVKCLEQRYPELLKRMGSYPTQPRLTATPITSQSTIQTLDFTSIIKASQVMSGEIVLDRLLVELMAMLLENANAQRGFLILEKGGYLVVEAQAEIGCEPTNMLQSIPLNDLSQQLCIPIVNYVARSREKVILGSAVSEGVFRADAYIQQHQVKSVLCLPILHRGKFVGALYLENNLVSDGFPEERVELLSILSSQAAISIENARLYTDLEEKVEERTAQLMQVMEELEELAITDKLTGLYNRRQFEEVLNAEIIRIQRFEHPGSLIIFDIDNFKEVNDTFGHQAGDEVLKLLATTVKGWLRNVDTLARWGGDEYTILMPETDLRGATSLAEKIRLGVAVQNTPTAGMVTISLGVTEYKTGDSMESMLKRADEALYRAKRNGRDRVET